MTMTSEKLVEKFDLTVNGETFSIMVFSRSDGKHYAKTHLNENDIIINDGASLSEVLRVHKDLLPLAVAAHKNREAMRRVSMTTPSCDLHGIGVDVIRH